MAKQVEALGAQMDTQGFQIVELVFEGKRFAGSHGS